MANLVQDSRFARLIVPVSPLSRQPSEPGGLVTQLAVSQCMGAVQRTFIRAMTVAPHASGDSFDLPLP